MPTFLNMAEILAPGENGDAKLTHFTVSAQESQFSSIRAMQHPGAYVRAGTYAQLTVGGVLDLQRALEMVKTQDPEAYQRVVRVLADHLRERDLRIAGADAPAPSE